MVEVDPTRYMIRFLECINTEKLGLFDSLVMHTCQNMNKHGLVEKAGVEPKDNLFKFFSGGKLNVLLFQCIENECLF